MPSAGVGAPGGVCERTLAAPAAGLSERGGGVLLGREGTSLKPKGRAGLRIRVDAGGKAAAGFEGLLEAPGEEAGAGTESGGALGLDSVAAAGATLAATSTGPGPVAASSASPPKSPQSESMSSVGGIND